MTARFTPGEFAMQLDAAKARAYALRQEAIRAGWDALGHALLRAWHAEFSTEFSTAAMRREARGSRPR
jgi:hypothetical protein